MKKNFLNVIEITESHLKFFQAKAQWGRWILTQCKVLALKEKSDQDIAQSLKQLKIPKRILRQSLILLIPRRCVILKRMRLPSLEDKEIQKMIGLQLIKHIPYSLDQVTFGYQLIERDGSGYSEVLVFVLPREVSGKYLKPIYETVALPTQLVLSSLGLLGWLSREARVFDSAAVQSTLLIDIDFRQTEACFCRGGSGGGKLIFSRALSFGARDLAAPKFLEELKLTLEAYQKQRMGPPVTEIILVSTSDEAKTFKEKLEKEFSLPVQLDPHAKAPVERPAGERPSTESRPAAQSKSQAESKSVIQRSSAESRPAAEKSAAKNSVDVSEIFKKHPGISLTAGLGVLEAQDQELPNLIPPEIDLLQKNQHKRRQQFQWACTAVVIFLLILAGLGKKYFEKKEQLQIVEEQIEQIHEALEDAQQRIQFFQSLNEYFTRRIFIADTLYKFYDLIPEDISLRSLSINERRLVTIQGYATLPSSVNNFQAGLLKANYLKEINLQFATKRRMFNQDIVDFKITAQLP